jgi:hypothetical protein
MIKILANAEEIEKAEVGIAAAKDNGIYNPEEHKIPKKKYKRTKMHFRAIDVCRYYIDTESSDQDLIVHMKDGDIYRCAYNNVVVNVLNTLLKYAY